MIYILISMRKRLYIGSIALGAWLFSAGAPIDAPKKLFLDGRYEEALPALQTLHKKTPRDGNAAYYLGATLCALDRNGEAVAPLKVAESRGVADASRLLAEIALDQYRPSDASDHLDTWETALRKNRKAAIPESLDEMRSRSVTMLNMMERVERVEIIDSLTVDAYDFFRQYRLSPEAGRLMDGTAAGIDGAYVAFRPQCGRELLWTTEPDSIGGMTLMGADILDDGTVENAAPLEIDIEADASGYPFLMPDGVTLYFAAESADGLGGYDIYMTRRTDDGSYLQPQNVGMPYNSPANDYLLAIDEAAGIGWWATDRNAPDGKVTIYEFIPSQRRVNVEPDAPDIAARARITSIAATQNPDTDYDALRRRVSELARNASQESARASDGFAIAMSDGTVRHSLAEFRNPEARRAMENLIGIDDEIAAISSDLSSLREKYRSGNTSVERRIIGLESELEKARARRRSAANKVVRLEK